MKRLLSLAVLVPASTVFGDTVYLKNGEWIDGMVSLKTNTFVELQIGDIGKIELALEEIHSIEKNSRTGGKSVEPYVEPKGKTEVFGDKAKGPSKGEGDKGASPDSAKRSEKKAGDNHGEKAGGKPGEKTGDNAADKEGEKKAGGEKGKSDPNDSTPDKEAKPDGEAKESPDEASASVKKVNIDPELKKRIEELVAELQREKARNRVQAERHLEAIGPPAIPFLVPIARSSNDLTRIAVMRLFHSFGDQQVIDVTLEGLLDENEYVRDYSNQTLKRITGEDFKYLPSSSPRRRENAHHKWADWWEAEKKVMAEERKKAEAQ
jgi:hypothetical protein